MNKILIIDDNEALANILSKLLKKNGYDVLSINSFNKGLNMIQNQPFHAILLDLPLTGFEKISSLSLLEKKGVLKNQNLILFTGLDISDSIIDEWKKKGLHSLIKKPTEFDAIIKELGTIVLTESNDRFFEDKITAKTPNEETITAKTPNEETITAKTPNEETVDDETTKEKLEEIRSTFNSLRSKLESIKPV